MTLSSTISEHEIETLHDIPLPESLASTATLTEYKPFPEKDAATGNSASPAARHLKLECVTTFLNRKLPPRGMVLAPILPAQGLAMLYAKRGVGKTFVALNMAYAVATGGEFLGWKAPRPHKCLYVDGEMPAIDLQARLASILEANESKLEPEFLRLLAMTDQELGVGLNLFQRADQMLLDKYLHGIEFLIIDNISTLVAGGNENDAESWAPVQPWLIELRKRGITVLLVHHESRGGTARGSSKREDILDTMVRLQRPDDYKESEGARFVVRYEKHRHFFGKDAMPFEAHLRRGPVHDEWLTTPVSEERDIERAVVAAGRADGKTVRQIAIETGMSRTKVGVLAKEAGDSGP